MNATENKADILFQPIPAVAVANYFVTKAFEDSVPITLLQVVKLTYLAHGWHLGHTHGKGLILEQVQAWKYGPVIPSVYVAFRENGDSPIKELAKSWSINGFQTLKVPKTDSRTTLLDNVWKAYGKYSGPQLSELTHQHGTPWDLVWNEFDGKNGYAVVIPDALIQKHYEERLKQSEESR